MNYTNGTQTKDARSANGNFRADEIEEAMSQADKDELFFKRLLELKKLPAILQQAASTAIKELEDLQREKLDRRKFARPATKRRHAPTTDEEKARRIEQALNG